jgi:hypothetical protein
MRPLLPVLAATALSCACSDKDSDDTADNPPEQCTDLTYENFGYGFIRTWCTPCHSASVEGDRRQCADPNLNFDTYDQVRVWAAEIDRKVSGDVAGPPPEDGICSGVPIAPDCTCVEQSDMQMPPAGGVTPEEAALLHEWVSCGAPGAPIPPPVCFDPVPSTGGASFATQADADTFCATGANRVAGDLAISGSVIASCVCGVDGTVSVTGSAADVSLPLLADAGALVAAGSASLGYLSAPELRTLTTGDLVLDALPALNTLDLPWLTEVAGHASFTDLSGLDDLPVGQLAVIGGDLTIAGNDFATADLTRIRTVGGSLAITDNTLLLDIDTLKSVDAIGLDLRVSGNALLAGLDIADVLTSIGGDVVIEENPSLQGIDGFTLLEAAQGVIVRENDELTSFDGFNSLLTVAGVTVADNPELLGLVAFENLATATGPIAVSDNPRLVYLALPWMVTSADLTISGNSLAQSLLLDALVTVGGDLVIHDNSALASIATLDEVATIAGDLVITDNPDLPTAAADGLAAQAEVGGTVTISGNQ